MQLRNRLTVVAFMALMVACSSSDGGNPGEAAGGDASDAADAPGEAAINGDGPGGGDSPGGDTAATELPPAGGIQADLPGGAMALGTVVPGINRPAVNTLQILLSNEPITGCFSSEGPATRVLIEVYLTRPNAPGMKLVGPGTYSSTQPQPDTTLSAYGQKWVADPFGSIHKEQFLRLADGVESVVALAAVGSADVSGSVDLKLRSEDPGDTNVYTVKGAFFGPPCNP